MKSVNENPAHWLNNKSMRKQQKHYLKSEEYKKFEIYKPAEDLKYVEVNEDNHTLGKYFPEDESIEYNLKYPESLDQTRQTFTHEIGHAYHDNITDKFTRHKFGKNADVKIDQVYENINNASMKNIQAGLIILIPFMI